jgi:hypothetical protein
MLSRTDTIYFATIMLCLCASAGWLPRRVEWIGGVGLIAGPAIALMIAAYRRPFVKILAASGNFMRPMAEEQPKPSEN